MIKIGPTSRPWASDLADRLSARPPSGARFTLDDPAAHTTERRRAPDAPKELGAATAPAERSEIAADVEQREATRARGGAGSERRDRVDIGTREARAGSGAASEVPVEEGGLVRGAGPPGADRPVGAHATRLGAALGGGVRLDPALPGPARLDAARPDAASRVDVDDSAPAPPSRLGSAELEEVEAAEPRRPDVERGLDERPRAARAAVGEDAAQPRTRQHDAPRPGGAVDDAAARNQAPRAEASPQSGKQPETGAAKPAQATAQAPAVTNPAPTPPLTPAASALNAELARLLALTSDGEDSLLPTGRRGGELELSPLALGAAELRGAHPSLQRVEPAPPAKDIAAQIAEAVARLAADAEGDGVVRLDGAEVGRFLARIEVLGRDLVVRLTGHDAAAQAALMSRAPEVRAELERVAVVPGGVDVRAEADGGRGGDRRDPGADREGVGEVAEASARRRRTLGKSSGASTMGAADTTAGRGALGDGPRVDLIA